ncbi:MAG: 3-dehydroquinate synthase [Chloroflexota bacterium]
MTDNVVLTGFMGVGKTAVGREVARQLGRPFVDMDTQIEARAGKSISRIFSEDGEAAFRTMETALCRELAAEAGARHDLVDGAIIATGGGALVNPENRALTRESGLVICLDADPEEILHRLSDSNSRPLLDGPDPRTGVERLMAARRQAYGAIPWHINTTGLSIAQVAQRVIALIDAISLSVRHPGGSYAIRIGRGVLNHVGGALRAAGVPPETRIAMVSNDVVAPLYAARVEEALRASGLHPVLCVIPDGEQHKTLATVASLYDQFLAAGLDRTGAVLSLGGGITGDIAGFAAATFMRGVPFAQVPTSLLAMVDASVGGKTGVDLPQGKNLVGAFKQPLCVTIDPALLETLEAAEVRSGMAEVIKHTIIGDANLFQELNEAGTQRAPGDAFDTVTSAQIARALQVKIAIVEEDPYEQDRRAVLNLGHTVGHALEKASRFKLRHGEAVSIGMVAAARVSARVGLAEPSVVDSLEATLTAWGLPVRCSAPGWPEFRADSLWEAMAYDKKRRGDALRWVLPVAIGEVTIRDDVPHQAVAATLKEIGAR